MRHPRRTDIIKHARPLAASEGADSWHGNIPGTPPHDFRQARFAASTFPNVFCCSSKFEWGRSSAGRASGWQSEGRRFDPVRLHHLQTPGNWRFYAAEADYGGFLFPLFSSKISPRLVRFVVRPRLKIFCDSENRAPERTAIVRAFLCGRLRSSAIAAALFYG